VRFYGVRRDRANDEEEALEEDRVEEEDPPGSALASLEGPIPRRSLAG
jgi:hypothetical protein